MHVKDIIEEDASIPAQPIQPSQPRNPSNLKKQQVKHNKTKIPKKMTRSVKSSWISTLTFDPNRNQTSIKTKTGKEINVDSLTPEMYNAWVKSDSKGKFFHSNIKNKYTVEEIENDQLGQPTLTPEEVAKKHNVCVEYVYAQLFDGIEVEKEHVNDIALAAEIALDHLSERPDYYVVLREVE